jgi:hypothetical protein
VLFREAGERFVGQVQVHAPAAKGWTRLRLEKGERVCGAVSHWN